LTANEGRTVARLRQLHEARDALRESNAGNPPLRHVH
jgi:hypothetical protein